MADKKQADSPATYDADNIRMLEGLEPVRLRPGMYIGSTDSRGLHHLVWEVVDNAVDEALAGHCTEIIVELDDKNVVTVTDNGRGIPVAINKATGRSALDLVFTELHAGGKFGDGGYKVSGGLHGVGASVTNALSHWLEAEIKRDGHVWNARWEKGGSKVAKKVTKGRALKKGEGTGSKISWLYDDTIFDKDVAYSHSTIEQRLKDKAYLVRGLTFILRMPGREEQVFFSKNGIADYIKELASDYKPVHPKVVYLSSEDHPEWAEGENRVPVEVAMQWVEKDEERIFSFANVISTVDGGAHVVGFKAAVTKAMNQFAEDAGKIKNDKDRFEGRDIMDGLCAAVSVKIEDPQFEGQTKGKLNNSEARTAVQTFVYAAFSDWLSDKRNAKEAKAILDRCLLSRDIRLAKGKVSKKLKDQVGSIFSDSSVPGKLADCQPNARPVEERELFICEGDSAAGPAKQGRDNAYQAILPIRGKILNVLESGASGKAFDNQEVEGILTALGGRKDVVGKRVVATLEPEMRRYGKVVILTDADTDGAHIAMLLMTLFYEIFPSLLQEGRVFLSKPPLFKVLLDGKGDKYVYAYSEEERSELVKKHKRSGDDVLRFKGLGEMNTEDLAETCLDPATRSLMQVTISDAAEAQETVTLLMGKGKAEGRREWLEEVGLETEAI